MRRRDLFKLLAFAATDPERLIWQPGKKLISIPKPVPVTLEELNRFTREYILPRVYDVIFQVSPFMGPTTIQIARNIRTEEMEMKQWLGTRIG